MRWICLDVGETLVDETRVWGCWADVLGVTHLTLFGAIGAMIATGRSHEEAFDVLGQSGWRQHAAEVESRYGGFRGDDLYPDVRAALAALRDQGYGVAVVGNQPASRHGELLALGVEADVLAMSDAMGVAKPDPAFFARVCELLRADSADIAYVGDRVDNDVVPAAAAGMRAVWVRRGPWGALHEDHTGAAALVVGSLDELARRAGRAWDDVAPRVRRT